MTARASVVVASFRGLDLLAQCLESIRPQCARQGAELIVARRAGEPDAALAQITAGCRLVRPTGDSNLPRLRGLGLTHAEAEWVVLTEDHCVAEPGWLEALLAAGRGSAPAHVVGGSMGNAQRERAIDCAGFLAEYGFYGAARPEEPAGAPPLVTGANVAYHRSVLAEVAEWSSRGCWENVIHDRLYAAGRRLRLAPDARMRQNQTYQWAAFCRNRFEHGRDYASARSATLPGWHRVALSAGTPALPAVLATRIARSVNRETRRDLARALPAMLSFLCAWAAGEAFGYLCGSSAMA